MGLRDAIGELTDSAEFDVVVIGSGYGAGVLAARLADAGHSVCVLERGREYELGDFPKRPCGVLRELQVDKPSGHHGNEHALFDVRVNRELSVLVGCGLGGTSLINANVSIRPAKRVFELPEWPKAIRENPAILDPYFARAKTILRPAPVETPPVKLRLLESMANHHGYRFHKAEINVAHAKTDSQASCNACGDCVSGCNYGAKNTLCETYLPYAKQRGAKLFTECRARWVEKAGDAWRVVYEHRGATRSIAARRALILGAGSLGSTEILMRSVQHGLTASPRLGSRFSGNGDSIAVGYNFDAPVDSVGFGARVRTERTVGPTITGIVDLRSDEGELHDSIIVEDGAFPGPFATLLRYAVQAAAVANNKPAKVSARGWFRRRWRELLDLFGADPLDALLNHSQLYLVIGHDGSGGTLELVDDRIRVRWPNVDDLPVFARAADVVAKLTAARQGDYVANPLAKQLESLITVHPLGGCTMGDDSDHGVVSDLGRVFDGRGDVHRGLYIVDGAIVPSSVGVNPLLAITALAERIAEAVQRELS